MKTLLRTALLATAILGASPAFAADAFTSFNGTQGAGGFTYGYTNGTTLTQFDASGPSANNACAFGPDSICLRPDFADDVLVPQASKGGSYPTVNTPSNALVLHPGNSAAQSAYAAYSAAALGKYSYTIDLQSVGRDTGNGIGYTPFTTVGGVVTLGTRSVLPTYLSTGTLNSTQILTAGQSFGVIIDFNGDYGGDSTALNFGVSAVPEPATWAMMLLGFGMVGFGLRSRKRPAVTVTYA